MLAHSSYLLRASTIAMQSRKRRATPEPEGQAPGSNDAPGGRAHATRHHSSTPAATHPQNDAPLLDARDQVARPGGSNDAPLLDARDQAPQSSLAEISRGWHRFPGTDVCVRVGADKNFPEGIYQATWAGGVCVYVLLEELPGTQEETNRAIQKWRGRGMEVMCSYGTLMMYDNELAIFPAEPTGRADHGTGFLVIGSRSHLGNLRPPSRAW